ncbi:MAG: hypothetical protein WC453_02255 [Patescibacteria group bacterium]
MQKRIYIFVAFIVFLIIAAVIYRIYAVPETINKIVPNSTTASTLTSINGFYTHHKVFGDKKIFFGGIMDVSKKEGLIIDQLGESRIKILDYTPNQKLIFIKEYSPIKDTITMEGKKSVVTWGIVAYDNTGKAIAKARDAGTVTYCLTYGGTKGWNGTWTSEDGRDSVMTVVTNLLPVEF